MKIFGLSIKYHFFSLARHFQNGARLCRGWLTKRGNGCNAKSEKWWSKFDSGDLPTFSFFSGPFTTQGLSKNPARAAPRPSNRLFYSNLRIALCLGGCVVRAAGWHARGRRVESPNNLFETFFFCSGWRGEGILRAESRRFG